MKTYLLDASVILCYLLEQQTAVTKTIEALLHSQKTNRAKLISTVLLPLEIGNGLRFTIKDQQLAQTVYKTFLKLPIELLSLNPLLLSKTLRQTYSLGATFYDTAYHLTAVSQTATFLTCDKAYYHHAKTLGWIKLLG